MWWIKQIQTEVSWHQLGLVGVPVQGMGVLYHMQWWTFNRESSKFAYCNFNIELSGRKANQHGLFPGPCSVAWHGPSTTGHTLLWHQLSVQQKPAPTGQRKPVYFITAWGRNPAWNRNLACPRTSNTMLHTVCSQFHSWGRKCGWRNNGNTLVIPEYCLPLNTGHGDFVLARNAGLPNEWQQLSEDGPHAWAKQYSMKSLCPESYSMELEKKTEEFTTKYGIIWGCLCNNATLPGDLHRSWMDQETTAFAKRLLTLQAMDIFDVQLEKGNPNDNNIYNIF